MSMNPSQPVQPVPPPAAAAAPNVPVPHKETPKASDPYKADVGHIGKSVQIKGELTGSEDLYLDGEIEGNIDRVLETQRKNTTAGDEASGDVVALNVAAHRLENLIHDRRIVLAASRQPT